MKMLDIAPTTNIQKKAPLDAETICSLYTSERLDHAVF